MFDELLDGSSMRSRPAGGTVSPTDSTILLVRRLEEHCISRMAHMATAAAAVAHGTAVLPRPDPERLRGSRAVGLWAMVTMQHLDMPFPR
jgi:hypothetical protein